MPKRELFYNLICLDCEHMFAVKPDEVKTAVCPKCKSKNVGSAGSCRP